MILSALGSLADPLEHVLEHKLKTLPVDLGPFGNEITVFSDHIAMIILAGFLLALFLPLAVRRKEGEGEIERLVPAGPANALEAVCQFLRTEVAEPSLGPHTDRFIKFVWTVFFFVLAINLLGLVPLGSLTPLLGTHIGGTATGNIWVTGTMATMALGMWVVNGLRLGGMQYLAHFSPGPLWLAPLMVLIEIIGVFAKAFALAIRLFANMIAGHILLGVLLGLALSVGTYQWLAGLGFGVLVIVPASVAINLLEVLVAVIQAFIFTFLTVIFLGQATVFHHGDEHGDEHGVALEAYAEEPAH
jgi:F-type H+-transporting ATPase subunit a